MNKPMSAVVRKWAQLSPTGQDRTSQDNTLLPATARRYAAEQVRLLDQLALIGYPILDPATRAVYEVTLRLGAEKLLDAVGEGR